MRKSPAREDPAATRRKLLDAASIIFAEIGYRSATIREICHRAGANVASVNYHFGDKLGLYTEVLKDCSAPQIQLRIRSEVAHAHSPDEQLRAFVRGMLEKMLASDRPAQHMQIMLQELANPTPALAAVIDQVIRPQYQQLCAVVGGVIQQPPKSTATRLCVHSVIGQVAHYFHGRAVIAQLWPQFKMTSKHLDEIADHIVRFTMAGLASTRASARRTHKKVSEYEPATSRR